MRQLRNIALSVVGLAVAGCASTAPPHELVAARTAYQQAASGPAERLDPADLHTAKKTLQAAEQSFQDDGDSQATRDIAYTAERRAQIAAARAETIGSQQQRQAVVAQMNAYQKAQAQRTAEALGRANMQLESQAQELEAEKQREAEAERAANDLSRIANVKHEGRDLVITLSGSEFFASGKADLLPAAQSKLNQVANVLAKKDANAKIVVQGYTDSRGSDALNQKLSQRRAEAVRAMLVSHGVPSDRVTAEGEGSTNPIADNSTAEGRADNRRVEIVVQPPVGGNETAGPK